MVDNGGISLNDIFCDVKVFRALLVHPEWTAAFHLASEELLYYYSNFSYDFICNCLMDVN